MSDQECLKPWTKLCTYTANIFSKDLQSTLKRHHMGVALKLVRWQKGVSWRFLKCKCYLISAFTLDYWINVPACLLIFGDFSSRPRPYFIEKICQFLKNYIFCVEKSIISYKKGWLLASEGNFPGGTFINFTKSSIRLVYSSRHAYSVVQSTLSMFYKQRL